MRFMMLMMIMVFLVACGNTEERIDENDAESGEMESVNLRNVNVETKDLEVNVTGEASTVSNEFYYRVDEEGNVIIEEAYLPLEETEIGWSEFELTLDLTEEYTNNEEPPIIVLYGKNSDGEIINPNYIPVDM